MLAEEADLGAVLARGPAVALVDDFAHRNAPGSRHRARWQDVEDLLAAHPPPTASRPRRVNPTREGEP
jgi:K+-sensing histidine kinase KdpD